jgi:hypothetical protein
MFHNRCFIAWHFAKLIHPKCYNMPPTQPQWKIKQQECKATQKQTQKVILELRNSLVLEFLHMIFLVFLN